VNNILDLVDLVDGQPDGTMETVMQKAVFTIALDMRTANRAGDLPRYERDVWRLQRLVKAYNPDPANDRPQAPPHLMVVDPTTDKDDGGAER
jgi:hypothetical protein